MTLNWKRVEKEDNGGAPILDDKNILDDKRHGDARVKYYGKDVAGDFGGYVLIRVDKNDSLIDRFPEKGTFKLGNRKRENSAEGS